MKVSDQISPALKSWLDDVIVPALVKAYVAELARKNRIAPASRLGIESVGKADPSSEGHS